jgi:hypothetical protein
MFRQRFDRRHHTRSMLREQRLTRWPRVVTLRNQACIRAHLANGHAALSQVAKERDPLHMTVGVPSMTARSIALHEGYEPDTS